MDKHPLSNKHYNLWIVLSHTRQAILRAQEKELLRYDITPEQVEALFCMQVIGHDVTPTQLSRCIIREPHTTAALVNRMEKRGLLKKIKDLPRKNMVRLELTDEGNKSFKKYGQIESISKIMSCLSKREVNQLYRILEKLQDKAFDEQSIAERSLGPPRLVKMIADYKRDVG